MASDYQKTLELVREWAVRQDHPFDIWNLRHSIERQAPDGTADSSSTSGVFMQRSLRAVNQLTDEGVLVKQGERNDAIYMTAEVHQRRQAEAKAAGERMNQHRENWHQAKMRLAALGLGVQDDGGPLGIRLPLESWQKILAAMEAGFHPAGSRAVEANIAAELERMRSLPGTTEGTCPDCGSNHCLYSASGGSAYCPACAWGAS